MRARIALATAVTALALPAVAQAAPFAVTNGNDSGSGSLRGAIDQANALAGGDSVTFASSVHTIDIITPLTVTGTLSIADSEGDVTVTSSGGGASPLIQFQDPSDGSRVERVTFTRSGGKGIEVQTGADRITVTRSPVFGSGILPIDLVGSGNAAIAAPDVRIGPRRADGSLPVNGTAPAGSVEIFRGDPRSSTATGFLDSTPSNGSFSYVPAQELQPGQHAAATVTDGSGRTSEFSATATVPSDVVSPSLAGARAISTGSVTIQPSEPLDPASVALADFAVEMAGARRQVTGGSIAPDGSSLTLTSNSRWLAGEAGFVDLVGPGAVTDSVGNQNLSAQRVRVAAAPGDFIAPVVTSLSFKPRRMCLTKNRRCRKPGMTVTFVSSEAGRGKLQAIKGRRTSAKNFDVKAGKNTYRFDGRFRGRKLRQGRYGLVITVTDAVGNEAAETPFKTFSVIRTAARRK